MAQRGANKVKRRPRRTDVSTSRRETEPVHGRDPLRTLEAEVARLRRENESLRQENRTLRETNEEVLNRIDWVIDALRGLAEP
jgi:hypothetical protein